MNINIGFLDWVERLGNRHFPGVVVDPQALDLIMKIFQPGRLFTGQSGAELLAAIAQTLEMGERYILIDFQDVLLIDSSGFRKVLAAYRMVKAAQGKLEICSLHGQPRMLFEMLHLDSLIPIHPDRLSCWLSLPYPESLQLRSQALDVVMVA